MMDKIKSMSLYVWLPALSLATFGALETWYDVYGAMWDTKPSTVVFVGIVIFAMVLDWWCRWLSLKYKI